jgi:four helix bundle protein
MRDFTNLQVWQKAHALTLNVYHASKSFPAEERYGLTSQIRRACSSIPTNLAEGCGTQSDAELCRYAFISMACSSEVQYELLLARDLDYLSQADYARLYDQLIEVRRMLNGFIMKLKQTTRYGQV